MKNNSHPATHVIKSNLTTAFWTILTITLTSLSTTSVSRAGVLIGNGDGVVEQNCFYAYINLPKAIASCIALADACGVTPADVNVLQKIQAIAANYPASANRILFTSDTQRPNFFETGLGQAHRVAQTGYIPTVPIYFNTDQFYTADGTPALDLPLLTAVLVHELGHQTGLVDHAYLDQLGAHIRAWMLNKTFTLEYPYLAHSVKVFGINYSSPESSSDLYFVDDSRSTSLASLVAPAANCADNSENLLGWSVENLHWDNPLDLQSSQPLILGFSGWLDIHCVGNGELKSEIQIFHMSLNLKSDDGKLHLLKAKLRSSP